MRIVVSAPPKTGNHWIGCLLSTIYDLEWPTPGAHAATSTPKSFEAFVAAGGFPDGTMFHHHSKFSAQLCDLIDAVPSHNVTILRDPYDVFVSMYYWEQERSSRGLGRSRPRPRHAMYDRPIQHEDVLEFLTYGYRPHIARALGWLESHRSLIIRYEDLHYTPVDSLKILTDQISPVSTARIEMALEACRADRVRQQDEKMAWHVRSARVGDSREKLSDVHLSVFRERHADLIQQLGYPVR